jgi:hypothetical protein
MLEKFGRNYILLVQLQDGSTLTIQPPFTVEFDITRNILTSANVCSIRIYNLGVINRNQIEFNIYNQTEFRAVQLLAGYGNTLATIFHGNITQAWSVREGVNFITQIECFDGGFAYNNAQQNFQFPAGTPNQVVIETLVANLGIHKVMTGAIGNFPGTTQRAKSYSGSTTNLLSTLTGGGFFIDNSYANCLGNSECLQGNIPLINSQSGLLGTPVREQNILTFDILFEPRVQAGQIIELESLTATQATIQTPKQAINGFYKISSVKHRGMISEAVCGDAITTLGMLVNPNGTPLTVVKGGTNII